MKKHPLPSSVFYFSSFLFFPLFFFFFVFVLKKKKHTNTKTHLVGVASLGLFPSSTICWFLAQ